MNHKLTTAAGVPVADNNRSLTAGPRGPMLMQDTWLFEKLSHLNREVIPVNRPRCPFHSFHRDGQMRTDGNLGDTLTYEPNSYHEWQEQPQFMEPPQHICGDSGHWDYANDDNDYFAQPRAQFLLMNAAQRQALFDNTARAMADVPEFIRQRHLEHCFRCHREYGEGVAAAFAATS